jgi:hypothetical protein
VFCDLCFFLVSIFVFVRGSHDLGKKNTKQNKRKNTSSECVCIPCIPSCQLSSLLCTTPPHHTNTPTHQHTNTHNTMYTRTNTHKHAQTQHKQQPVCVSIHATFSEKAYLMVPIVLTCPACGWLGLYEEVKLLNLVLCEARVELTSSAGSRNMCVSLGDSLAQYVFV